MYIQTLKTLTFVITDVTNNIDLWQKT